MQASYPLFLPTHLVRQLNITVRVLQYYQLYLVPKYRIRYYGAVISKYEVWLADFDRVVCIRNHALALRSSRSLQIRSNGHARIPLPLWHTEAANQGTFVGLVLWRISTGSELVQTDVQEAVSARLRGILCWWLEFGPDQAEKGNWRYKRVVYCFGYARHT